MKKTLVSALTTALVVGAASTTFAGANPFSDVPEDHWAYDAVQQLVDDGVVKGLGDGTFRGDKYTTRYEMAQIVAKAMANTKVDSKDKALIEKLKAEFEDELNSLGVRVDNLEKHADMVQWTGKLEYTYHSTRIEDKYVEDNPTVKKNSNGYVFRLEPKAEVNEHWTVNARLDAEGDLKDDSSNNVRLQRAWAQGNYDNFQVKLGKFEFCPSAEHGLLWDTEISGAELSVGKDFKGVLTAGRLASNKVFSGFRISDYNLNSVDFYDDYIGGDDPSSLIGLGLQYDAGKNFYGGLAYYHVKDSDLKTYAYSNNGNEDTAGIFTVNAGYRFSPKADLWANYARNSKADFDRDSWQAEFDYGTYTDNPEKGAWGVYVAYRKFGYNTTFQGTMFDDALRGTKGWAIGAKYAPFKNVGLIAKYFNGKTINDHGLEGEKVQKLFGRVEFFF